MKIERKIPTVVYPSSTINGYGAVWSLGKARIPVIALASGKTRHFQSRFVTESYVTPHAAHDTDNFIDFLVELGKQKKTKMVLYMMNDVYAYIASAYRDRLETYYLYPYLSREQLEATLNKRWMYKAAVSARMQLPDTWFPMDPSWGKNNAEGLNYPVIIKPLVSRFSFENKTIGQVVAFPAKHGKAIEIHGPGELCEVLHKVLKEGFSVCVQERIKCRIDDLWTHHFYCADGGEILADFTGRKLHQEPPDFGTGSVCRAEINRHIVQESQKFLKEIKYCGLGNIEYIDTPEGYKLVEINPRPFFWCSLGTSVGVNLYKSMYDHLCGRPINPNESAQQSRAIIWYDLNKLMKFFRYKEKTITIAQFLSATKMEAIVNWRDLKISTIRIIGFVREAVSNAWGRVARLALVKVLRCFFYDKMKILSKNWQVHKIGRENFRK